MGYLMALIASMNNMSVQIAFPWVIIISSSSVLPFQQSSSTHLEKKIKNSMNARKKHHFINVNIKLLKT